MRLTATRHPIAPPPAPPKRSPTRRVPNPSKNQSTFPHFRLHLHSARAAYPSGYELNLRARHIYAEPSHNRPSTGQITLTKVRHLPLRFTSGSSVIESLGKVSHRFLLLGDREQGFLRRSSGTHPIQGTHRAFSVNVFSTVFVALALLPRFQCRRSVDRQRGTG